MTTEDVFHDTKNQRLPYLNRHSAFMPQLTSNDGSLASRLIHARAEIQVTGLPSQTVILSMDINRYDFKSINVE